MKTTERGWSGGIRFPVSSIGNQCMMEESWFSFRDSRSRLRTLAAAGKAGPYSACFLDSIPHVFFTAVYTNCRKRWYNVFGTDGPPDGKGRPSRDDGSAGEPPSDGTRDPALRREMPVNYSCLKTRACICPAVQTADASRLGPVRASGDTSRAD